MIGVVYNSVVKLIKIGFHQQIFKLSHYQIFKSFIITKLSYYLISNSLFSKLNFIKYLHFNKLNL